MKIYHSLWTLLKEDPDFERLCREYREETGKAPWGGKPVYDESDVPVGRVIVVRDDGRLVGFATVRPSTQDGERTAVVDALYIEKASRNEDAVARLVKEARRVAVDVYESTTINIHWGKADEGKEDRA